MLWICPKNYIKFLILLLPNFNNFFSSWVWKMPAPMWLCPVIQIFLDMLTRILSKRKSVGTLQLQKDYWIWLLLRFHTIRYHCCKYNTLHTAFVFVVTGHTERETCCVVCDSWRILLGHSPECPESGSLVPKVGYLNISLNSF